MAEPDYADLAPKGAEKLADGRLSTAGLAARYSARFAGKAGIVIALDSEKVDESLRAVEGRPLNTAALLGLIGRGALGWDGLLADARYGAAQSRLPPAAA